MRLETYKRDLRITFCNYMITILSKPGDYFSLNFGFYMITKCTVSSSMIALNVTKMEPRCWLLNADSFPFFFLLLFFRMFYPTHRAHRHKTIHGIPLYIRAVLLISQTQDKIQDILIRFQRHWSLFFYLILILNIFAFPAWPSPKAMIPRSLNWNQTWGF